MKRKKAMDLDTLAEDVLIEEIRDGDVEEVSGVDQPAIARGFTGFKRAGGKPRASKTFKRPPVDAYEACPRPRQPADPGTCEGGTRPRNRTSTPFSKPTTPGHDFEHDYARAKAVPEGADPAVFERCLEDVMDRDRCGRSRPRRSRRRPQGNRLRHLYRSGRGQMRRSAR